MFDANSFFSLTPKQLDLQEQRKTNNSFTQTHHHPVCVSHIHRLLLSPAAAQFVVQPPSSGGPLRRQPADASPHEAQRLLPGTDPLQQRPDVRLEAGLQNSERKT